MTDLPHKKVKGKHGDTGFELAPEVLNNRDDILTFLRTRRSTVAADITAPGPDEAQLDHMMEAACRVPDHGKLAPWRFIILRDETVREAFAETLARHWRAKNPGTPADAPVPEVDFIRQAPLVVVVVSSPMQHPKIPEWEQQLSAGAVCLNLLHAAIATGFAAQWRSGWPAYDEQAAARLGLAEGERVAGFIYIGTRRADAPPLGDRRRPFWRDKATFPATDEGGESA